MSGNFSQPTEVVQRIVSVEKEPSRLSEDPAPALSSDLNANGFSINKVQYLDAELIYCPALTDKIAEQFDDLQELNQVTYAKKEHKHKFEDIEELAPILNKALETAIGTRSPVGHTHKAQEIDGMKEIVEFIVSEMGYAKAGHDHLDIQKKIDVIVTELNKKCASAEIQAAIEKLVEAHNILNKRINEVDAKVAATVDRLQAIPEPMAPVKEPEEIVTKVFVSEKVLIPMRCNGFKINEIKAFDFNSNPILIESSKTVGATVAADEQITLKSTVPCFVRILFKNV